MSQRPPAPAWTPDQRVLCGALWLAGGVFIPLGAGLSVSLGVGLLILGIWCMATSVLIERRR